MSWATRYASMQRKAAQKNRARRGVSARAFMDTFSSTSASRGDAPLVSLDTPAKPLVCAWCQPPSTVPGVSHGMCQACSDRLIFEAMKLGETLAVERTIEEAERARFHALITDPATGPILDAMIADNAATDAAIDADEVQAVIDADEAIEAVIEGERDYRDEDHDEDCGSQCSARCGYCGRCS